MTDPVLFDAAYPGPGDPHVNGCIFYGGGDTPHIWTATEIRNAPGRFRLFCWVRSNPQAVSAVADTQACLNALKAVGYPKGKAVLLDLETAIDQAYVNTFGQMLHAAGYLVWDYGSKSTLFANPALDGYFPSDPTGVDHVNPGWVGCQFSFNGSYDEDDVTRPDLLWDLQAPTPTPTPPAPVTTEVPFVNLNHETVNIPLGPNGAGWTPSPVAIPYANVTGVWINSGNMAEGQPPTPGTAKAQNWNGDTYIEVEGGTPGATVGVIVAYTS